MENKTENQNGVTDCAQAMCSTARGTYEGAGEGYCTKSGGYYNLYIRVSISDGERIIKDNPKHQMTIQW